jgi:hypothetical protein
MRDPDRLGITRTEDMDTIVARGRILWNSIYEPYEDKLHDKLNSYHPDFMGECTPTCYSIFCRFRFMFFVRGHWGRSILHAPPPRWRPVLR